MLLANSRGESPDPGFRRPFNFFGVLTEEDMRHLEVLAKNSRESNVTVWFGHYPTSVISSAAPGIANVMSGGVAYLSGHLHTLGGLLPELYAMQKSGTLELELGDWKDNRLFRLMAVDHDLFSFTDVNFNDWPMAIITNPKDVRFYAPVHEPLDRISRSTHVRVLAFSPRGIRSVEVQLPDEKTFKPAKRVDDSPLFILPWDVSRYAVGTHTIRAKITDNDGRVREIVHDFATRDAEVPTFGIIRRLVLMADLGKLFATLTYGIAFANLFVLMVFGTNAIKTVYGMLVRRFALLGVPSISVFRDLHAALSIPWVFRTLFFSTAYVVVMPWFYGEIVGEAHGTVFTYGIWMDGQWLQGQMTYMFAVTHLSLHCTPLSLCTALYVRSRLKHPAAKMSRIFYHVVYVLILLLELWSLKIFADSYGMISVTTNGILVYSGIMPALFLWWKSWNLPSGQSDTSKYTKVQVHRK
ncbi:Transmembrane protein 62 [Hypsibius exemplaris]|uniref:Transmembrane protein 62 n=1 Tax=Hypsibius exemplaris TaxID=2072580 RepID=A0A9X6NGZ4_HYPEX|nr:Transmembrane protein 62 [Hypsibius exemplaris]